MLEPGQQIAHYRIARKIGEGGMGTVYLATDTKLGREVALKVLPEAFARDPERVSRFRNEARTLASLDHPHIAAIHGFEEAGGVSFLVLEVVLGEDLEARLASGPMRPEEALRVAAQIAGSSPKSVIDGVPCGPRTSTGAPLPAALGG